MRCKPCTRRPWAGCAQRFSGPRQIDPHVAASLRRQSSKTQYRTALAAFLAFLAYYNLAPSQPWEVDDLLVEYKNDNMWAAPPTKKQFENTIAAIEKAMPTFRGQLLYARAAMNSWRVLVKPSHTIPMSRPWAFLLGTRLSQMGFGRVGALLILQYLQCCRPSEVLGLTGRTIVTASEYFLQPPRGALLLGEKAGTKSGRPQASIVSNPIALRILQHFRLTTGLDDFLTSHRSLSAYAKLIRMAMSYYGMEDIGWTPHSPRAGYVSDAAVTGRSFVETREHGRWVSDRSLRIYMDIMAVMAGDLMIRLRPYHGLVRDLEICFDRHFVWW